MKTRIAELRRRHSLTQEQLAATVGITRQTVIALEQGRYNPSLALACRIARALGAKRVEDVFEVEAKT
jgi:putative transcriptional regulator